MDTMDIWMNGFMDQGMNKKTTPRFLTPANHTKIQLSSQPLIFYV